MARILQQVKNHYQKQSIPDHVTVDAIYSDEAQIYYTWLKKHKFKNYKAMQAYAKKECFVIEGVPIPYQDYVMDMLCPTPWVPDNDPDEEKKTKYNNLKRYILELMNGMIIDLPESDKKIVMQRSPKAMMS